MFLNIQKIDNMENIDFKTILMKIKEHEQLNSFTLV